MSAPDSPAGLPMTGGLLTLPLTVIGIAAIAIGGLARAFGYTPRRDQESDLPDLSHLAGGR